MPFAAALSTRANAAQAVAEACDQAGINFAGSPDLAVVFFSPHHADEAERIVAAIHERLSPRGLLG
jgi:small ligand-binding sensory domain FIST